MPRVKKVKEDTFSFIIDKKEKWKYKRKGRNRKRLYEIFMHRNNTNMKYCAYFGYWKSKKFNKVWIGTGDDCEDLREELDQMYENHIGILTGEIKLVQVHPKLLEDGYAPVQKNGKVLPEPYWEDIFMIEKRFYNKSFDMKIMADNGKTFKIASEHFKRIYVDNWFLC